MKQLKYLWFTLVLLLLLYAFNVLVVGITIPTFDPNIHTFTDRIARAFIAIALAAGIVAYMKHLTHD
jgi:hypothetical protein